MVEISKFFKRATVIKNCYLRLPVLRNDIRGRRKFALAYDPAHQYCNSVCLIGEFIFDENVGYRLEICNGISFVDIEKRKKLQ